MKAIQVPLDIFLVSWHFSGIKQWGSLDRGLKFHPLATLSYTERMQLWCFPCDSWVCQIGVSWCVRWDRWPGATQHTIISTWSVSMSRPAQRKNEAWAEWWDGAVRVRKSQPNHNRGKPSQLTVPQPLQCHSLTPSPGSIQLHPHTSQLNSIPIRNHGLSFNSSSTNSTSNSS